MSNLKKVDLTELKFHPSSWFKLEVEPKTIKARDAGELSETTKQFLWETFIEEKYGRRKQVLTKQMLKGLLQEEDAITLYSRFKNKMYYKNEVRIENDFLTGEPDLSDQKDVMQTIEGVDMKCSWDVFTFPHAGDVISKQYEYQNQGYMALIPSAKSWVTAHALVNAPDHQIIDEKRKLWYKLNQPDLRDDVYVAMCAEIEKNMIFDMGAFQQEYPKFEFDVDINRWCFDIPLEERIFEFQSIRDEGFIELMPSKALKAKRFIESL